jgi:hypothetical protein
MDDVTLRKRQDELNEKIKRAIDFRKVNKDAEYLKNTAYYENLHWKLPELADDKPFLVQSDINHLKNATDLRLASLYATDYIGTLIALSPEDIKVVEQLQIVYASEWNRLKFDELVKRAIKSGAILGESYVVFNYNMDKTYGGTNAKNVGAVTAEFLTTSSVYLDPSATSFEDSDYIVTRIRRTKDWVKRNKPEWYSVLKSKQTENVGTTRGIDSGEFYVGHDYTTGQNNIYMLDMVYEKVSNKVDKELETGEIISINKQGVRISYIINDTLVEENNDYPFDCFPIVQFAWEEMEQSPYCIPLLRGLTTPQKVVNLIESAMNNIAIHYTIPTILVSDESGLDAKQVATLSGAAGLVMKVSGDLTNAMQVVRPPSIDSQLLIMKDSFINNIREYAGVTQAYQGVIGTAGNTTGGANTAVGRATMIDVIPLTQIEKFVERATYVLNKYLTHYKQNETMYTKTMQKDTPIFNNITMTPEMEDIEVGYSIDLSIKTQNDKNRQFQTLLQLYQLQNQYKDPTQLINSLDLVKTGELDNYDELYVRYANMTENSIDEKSKLIVELMQISQTPKPDGTPLIDAQTLQTAIIDVINDDGDLSMAESIFKTYEDYQANLMSLENDITGQIATEAQNNETNQADMDRQNILNNKLGAVSNGVQQG